MSDTRAWTTTASIAAYDADWQKPARTEQYAYEQLVRHGAEGSSWFYVAFPWANLIDGHARGTALGVRLDEALARFEKPVGKKRIVTVCQHIKFRQYLELFERIGITDLFASHAEVGEKRIGTINIHPFPLYPVQAEQAKGAGTIDVATLLARPHLFSFVGAYNPKYYLTPVRSWIAELADTPGAHIVYRDQWHFEKRVYDNQVYGKSRTEADEKSEQAAADDFVELLKKTQFSLCPSGTGPNSIRLWESLEYGCIPVILADRLALPGDNDIWRRACVFVAETLEAVAAMPAELEALAGDPDRVAEKLAACAILRDRYGLKGFTTDLEAFLAWLDAEARATVGRDERDTTVYLDCALLDADAIAQWKTFLETACRNIERNLRIVLESPNRSDGCAPAASALDGHDWAREDLVVLSDSRPISRKLLKVFRKFYVRPSSAPTLVNIDLAVGRLVADDGAVSAPAPAECWLPICTLVSSTYDGDEYIRGFVDNCAAFERYPDIEHFIALANSPGHEVETLLAHTRANPAVVFVWMTWDPGLYEVWNYYCGLSTSRYVSTSNIDDKRAPNHVHVVVDMLDEETGCDVGSTGLRIAKDPSITWDTSAGLTEWYVGGRRVHKRFDDLYRVRDGIVKSHNFPHCLPVWRTALMPVNGSFNEKDFGSSADWEYWLRAAQRGSVFAHLEEPLGLYYIAPASYWRRNPKAHQYEDNIRRKYFRSDLSHRPQEAQLAGFRVKDALAAHGDGRYLEAFLLLWRLACDLEMETLAGERLHTLVAFMATSYGIEGLEVLARGREWRDGRPSSELALCMSALVDAVHAQPEMTEDACREIAQVAHDYFVRTTDVKGLVLLALLMRRQGRLNGEARLLDWSYAFAGQKLFGALSDVYRFTVPLAEIV